MSENIAISPQTSAPSDRPVGPAVKNGWKCRCPACGLGDMMLGYLKVRDACPECGQEMGQKHRADDGPAYLTILIVGHILGPVLLWAFVEYRPNPWVMSIIFSIGVVAMSLWLLPRLKGMVVGLQWSRRMHGFKGEP